LLTVSIGVLLLVIVRLLSEVFRLQHLHGEAFVIGQVTPYVAGALFAAVAFALTVICYFASLFRIFMLNPQTLSNIGVKAMAWTRVQPKRYSIRRRSRPMQPSRNRSRPRQ
jgi:hypothetical protein